MPVVDVAHLSHHYGSRAALSDVTFSVDPGEIFALLGPNGSGKTTLFRILSTLHRPEAGTVKVFDCDLAMDPAGARARMGVVFQSPSLDPKLTVRENLVHHGHLYGLTGSTLVDRIGQMMEKLHIADRAGHRVETLSGGLARRVELAKCFLHKPGLLILDEPSTGLDPGARHDLWVYLETLRREDSVTVLVTTHLTEEGDRADRVLVLDEGRIVALDSPDTLKSQIGGDVISLVAADPQALSEQITERFGLSPKVLDGSVRFEKDDGHAFIAELFESFPRTIQSVTVARPTLEDVFIARTGHTLWEEKP
jgi:ABC-2 type transport system ATP-binding protein